MLLDLIPNHTSDLHEWFQNSVKKIPPYTDYYVWKDPKYVNGVRHPPNNWVCIARDRHIFQTKYLKILYYFIVTF